MNDAIEEFGKFKTNVLASFFMNRKLYLNLLNFQIIF